MVLRGGLLLALAGLTLLAPRATALQLRHHRQHVPAASLTLDSSHTALLSEVEAGRTATDEESEGTFVPCYAGYCEACAARTLPVPTPTVPVFDPQLQAIRDSLPPISSNDRPRDLSRLTCTELGWELTLVNGLNPKVCAFSEVGPNRNCSKPMMWADAKRSCDAMGARLCTAYELQTDEASLDGVRGCHLDDQRLWTQTRCADGISVYTQSGSAKYLRSQGVQCQALDSELYFRCCADEPCATVPEPPPPPAIATTITIMAAPPPPPLLPPQPVFAMPQQAVPCSLPCPAPCAQPCAGAVPASSVVPYVVPQPFVAPPPFVAPQPVPVAVPQPVPVVLPQQPVPVVYNAAPPPAAPAPFVSAVYNNAILPQPPQPSQPPQPPLTPPSPPASLPESNIPNTPAAPTVDQTTAEMIKQAFKAGYQAATAADKRL